MFGLKWSLVGFGLALCFLAGCSGLFDERVPRYNTVEGPRRPPPLNVEALNKISSPQVPMNTSVPQSQPAPQASPYTPRPTGRLEQAPRPASNDVEQRTAREHTPWWDVTSWFDSDEPQQGPVPTQRAVPQENMSQLSMEPAVQAVPTPPVAMTPLATPQLSTAPAPTPSAMNTRDEIAALERELAASQARKAELAQQSAVATPIATAPAHLPSLETLQPNASYPALQPEVIDRSTAPVDYKVVRLPPPPSDAVAAPAAIAPAAVAPQPAPQPVPVASPDVYYAPDPRHYEPIPGVNPNLPMPPVITAPPAAEVAAPVYQEVQPQMDVPMAPEVSYTSPALSHSAPIQLTPPSRGAYSGVGYLEDSRYVGRRY